MEYLKKIFCSSLLFYMRAWAVHISEEKDLVNNYKDAKGIAGTAAKDHRRREEDS